MERLVLLCTGDQITIEDLPATGPGAGTILSDLDREELGLKEYVRAHTAKLERSRIQEVLETESNNVTRAAKALGISRKSLQTKMKDYGLRDS